MATQDTQTKPKRKKIFWACKHCNKAHITCESARPCSRCIKKGLQDTCEDAPRKRKKYLADVPVPLISGGADSANSDGQSTFFKMEPSQSVKTEGASGRPQLYEATSFQHSASLPDYLIRKQVGSVGANDSRHSPSLFARSPYNNGYFERSSIPQNGGQSQGQNPEQNPGQTSGENQNQPQNINPSPLFGPKNANDAYPPKGPNPHDSSAFNQSAPENETGNPPKRDIQPGTYAGATGKSSERKRPNFLSSAADMEYATLSSILQGSFMGLSQTHSLASSEGTPTSVRSPALSPHGYNDIHKSPQGLGANYAGGFRPADRYGDFSEYNSYDNSYNSSEFPPYDAKTNQYFLGNTAHYANVKYPEVSEALDMLKQNNPALFFSRNSKSSLSLTVGFPAHPEISRNLQFKDPEEIYEKIKKPFSYTPGFHKLIAYLRSRFPRAMLVKMAESMAVYRPSFIACTNSLRESDLIFMEQCFQRTLLTYDDFIKVSGTPTIVWRRTGEIAYVGHEFTTLTGWTPEQLLGDKPTFIVELLDDQSVVEYFQLFSRIAFGDFLGATMTECTLLTPKENVKIRAGCSWTMKRDVFGIPMMIIGNFLPII